MRPTCNHLVAISGLFLAALVLCAAPPASAQPADRAALVGAKVDELATRIEERVQAQLLADRATAAVEVARIAVTSPPPALREAQFRLQQLEMELEFAADRGAEHPRYKRFAAMVEQSRKEYARQVEAARARAAADTSVAGAERELMAARERLKAATERVDATKRELVDLVKGQ